MQIGFSQFYDRSSGLMQRLTQDADRLNTQIATGLKLNNASDDVVAYQRLSTIRVDAADDKAAGANVSLAQGMLQQADSVLTNVGTELQHAMEMVTKGRNGTLTASARQTIGTELQGVIDNIVSLANTKDLRGQPLFGAASGDRAVTVAANGRVGFVGTGEPSAIPIGDAGTVQASDSAKKVFGNVRTSAGTTSDVFAVLGAIVAALKAGDAPAADAPADVTAALDSVTAAQGSLAARANRLDLVAEQLTNADETRESERSKLEDADPTVVIAQLQKTMTILSATQASFSKLADLSLFNYLR